MNWSTPSEPVKEVVLFAYEWYNPTHPGRTHQHNHYKIIEINHTKKYEKFDPFIIAQNARQVYYLSYPRRCKSNWRVVIKCKPRGRVQLEEVSEQAY